MLSGEYGRAVAAAAANPEASAASIQLPGVALRSVVACAPDAICRLNTRAPMSGKKPVGSADDDQPQKNPESSFSAAKAASS